MINQDIAKPMKPLTSSASENPDLGAALRELRMSLHQAVGIRLEVLQPKNPSLDGFRRPSAFSRSPLDILVMDYFGKLHRQKSERRPPSQTLEYKEVSS